MEYFCDWDTARFLIFSANVYEPLIYYSHIGSSLISILLGTLVFINNPKNLINRSFFGITFLYLIWAFFDLILWSSEKPELIMFIWSLIVPVEFLIFVTCWYFVSIFSNHEKKISNLSFLLVFLTFLPFVLFTHTKLNLPAFDLTNCDREAVEGPLTQYLFAMQVFYILWITRIGFKEIRRSVTENKKQILLITIGIVSFLSIFALGNILITYFFDSNWSFEQYKLFGVPVLVGLISYSCIKFKTFDVKVILSQVLVTALAILVLSIAFIRTISSVQIVVSATFFLVCILGYILIKNVKHEIKQREELELLTHALEKANARLRELDKQKSEFVSIASHQLRSPLTAMRGYASMLTEGSFGKLPEKALEAARRIEESAKLMVMSVEDYLNVSRIESGNMKYNLSEFNVKEMTEKICDDLRPEAMKQSLILLFRSDIRGKGMVNADVGKTNQIIHNLINNSIKYTPKGSVSVFVRDDLSKKRIYVDITDTGIGMSQETMHTLFQKFSRADNANSVNVSGTGLGLYVAAKMAEQMGGKITCKSDGDGKGSTFTFELPVVG